MQAAPQLWIFIAGVIFQAGGLTLMVILMWKHGVSKTDLRLFAYEQLPQILKDHFVTRQECGAMMESKKNGSAMGHVVGE